MHLRIRIYLLLIGLAAQALLAGCGSEPEITRFKKEIETFCTDISELDSAINGVDAESSGAATEVLSHLDELDRKFRDFAELDFPKEFDYLESVADEAAEYMSTAVESYHEAYADNGYDEMTGAYARENSARALKRIQVILTVLQGKEPQS